MNTSVARISPSGKRPGKRSTKAKGRANRPITTHERLMAHMLHGCLEISITPIHVLKKKPVVDIKVTTPVESGSI